jgi:hypothetical protein
LEYWIMTVRPANPEEPLPELVLVCHQTLTEEGAALRTALADFSASPQPGCPQELDGKAWSQDAGDRGDQRRRLLALTQHQVTLICVNAYDHLLTLARALGSDGAMSLYAHSSLSRVVCEAAVRFAWILDPDAGSEERIMRGAVALLVSVDERLRGVTSIPAAQFDPRLRQAFIDVCTSERDSTRQLISAAGIRLAQSDDGRKIARLEFDAPKVRVPVKLDITDLMTKLLPDSPSWYNISSSVTHSHFWGLRDAVISAGGEPLAMTSNLMDVGAAAECAISASGLIIARHAAYYGHDPKPHVTRSQERRARIDHHMKLFASSR